MDEAQVVLARRDALVAAFNHTDIDALSELVAEDVVTMPPHLPSVVGRRASREWWAKWFASTSMRYTPLGGELAVFGDHAVDRYPYVMTITPPGSASAIAETGHCVLIWRRDPDGQWRVESSIWNSDRPLDTGTDGSTNLSLETIPTPQEAKR